MFLFTLCIHSTDLFMLRLIYTSTQRDALAPHDLNVLCDRAAENNRQRGLSGVLLYNGREFLQCLEGDRNNVASIYQAIIQDHRHTDIRLLQSAPIRKRLFSGWAMCGFMVANPQGDVMDETAYSFLDQRLRHPWKSLGQSCVDLISEYAQVKAELERAGVVKSFHLI